MNVHERIGRALRYLEEHIDETISLDELAKQSMYAPFHFHHLFKGLVGEGVAEYQRRLKMQRAASMLRHGKTPIIDIALQAGYGSQEAFTRAFKRWSSYTPKQYRTIRPKHNFVSGEQLMNAEHNLLKEYGLTVKIKEFEPITVACIRHTGPYTECGDAHNALCYWGGDRGLFNSTPQSYGIPYDEPATVPEDKYRYDACLAIPDDMKVDGNAEKKVIPGGRYACIIHKGHYRDLAITYRVLLGEWLPQSGEEIINNPPVQVYLNNIADTKDEDLLTEVRIALA